MKTYLLIFLCMFSFFSAQEAIKEQQVLQLPILSMKKGVNIHLISPEPIEMVDLSSDLLEGDLPLESLARIKIKDRSLPSSDSLLEPVGEKAQRELGIISVVGKSFLAQYRAVEVGEESDLAQSSLRIDPKDMQPLELFSRSLSDSELKLHSARILKEPASAPIKQKSLYGLEMLLNNIYVQGDYIFLDLGLKNLSNLGFEIEKVEFFLEDKNLYRSVASQSYELTPLFELSSAKSLKKRFRNIYVLEKLSFPNSKVLKIRIVEKPLSGRTLEMKVSYSDILRADTF